jgi:hypothetical protein
VGYFALEELAEDEGKRGVMSLRARGGSGEIVYGQEMHVGGKDVTSRSIYSIDEARCRILIIYCCHYFALFNS